MAEFLANLGQANGSKAAYPVVQAQQTISKYGQCLLNCAGAGVECNSKLAEAMWNAGIATECFDPATTGQPWVPTDSCCESCQQYTQVYDYTAESTGAMAGKRIGGKVRKVVTTSSGVATGTPTTTIPALALSKSNLTNLFRAYLPSEQRETQPIREVPPVAIAVPEKKFPWLLVGGGVVAAALLLAVVVKIARKPKIAEAV